MPRLALSIDIAASRERVWEVLTDFDTYDQWSPYENIRGEARRFGMLKVLLKRPDGWGDFPAASAVIWTFEPLTSLAYSSGKPLIFATRRFFHLADIGERTRLEHGLEMTGLLALRRFANDPELESLKPYYRAFGVALAKRAGGPPSENKTHPTRSSRRLSTNRKPRSF